MEAPVTELSRSFAAAAVGRLAQRSGLFFSHFEHLHRLELPAHWEPHGRPDLRGPTAWRNGELPEVKFRDFRLDRMVASFHPTHGPKWSAHELCHRLVGFAWKPNAGRLYLATAARLAELLPVALWYFFDEVGLRRCPDHLEQGAFYERPCPACDDLAAEGPDPSAPLVEHWQKEGRRYIELELRAIGRSLREGRPISHRYMHLDLATDSLAWATAHGPRLESPAFHRWIELFFGEEQGRHANLPSLEERVQSVLGALTGEWEPAPLRGTQDTWIRQDLGWRLLQVTEHTEGEVALDLTHLVERLAEGAAVDAVIAAYEALFEEWELPDPRDVFAVGYDLPGGYGRSASQIFAGLRTACPGTLRLLQEAAEPTVATFVSQDRCERQGVARRFHRFLLRQIPDYPVTELCGLEAALCHAPYPDTTVESLRHSLPSDRRRRLGPGVELLSLRRSWGAWLSRRRPAELPVVPPPLEEPQQVAIR
ncbi:MAG TPA: hypothetical protein PLA94_20400, partial [Myxococcota bacterium]|nr:hypothetical protein [Myxococcota bacterium]